jgi:hypothetical protein
MKRIRNIKDLEHEKLKLRVKQLELEKLMERTWHKITSQPSVNEPVSKKSAKDEVQFNTGNQFLSGALNYGASFLSHKLGMLAGKRIEGLAEHALEKLAGKMNAAISKRKKG